MVKVCSIIYFALLCYVTFFSKRRDGLHDYRSRVNFCLTANFRFYADSDFKGRYFLLSEVIGNLLIFIPFPIAVYYLSLNKKLSNIQLILIILSATIAIESIQYIFNIGVFDINDIVLNLAGGATGMYIHNNLQRKYTV